MASAARPGWRLERPAGAGAEAPWRVHWPAGSEGDAPSASLWVALMEAALGQALAGGFDLLDFRVACMETGRRPEEVRAVLAGGGRSIGFAEVEFRAAGTLLATARATVRRR